MRSHIFSPAGMWGSYLLGSGNYLQGGDALNYPTQSTIFGREYFFTGAMGQVSSTNDFIGFFSAMRAGYLISDESLAMMREARGELFGQGYGLGLLIGDASYGHGGLLDGNRSDMFIHEILGLQVVILANGGQNSQNLMSSIRDAIYKNLE